VLQLQPAADGAGGERAGWFGRTRDSACEPPHPTCKVTLKHPYTGHDVIVPLALPDGTPLIEHVRQRVVYDYGSYTVQVQFLPDGGVDVIYNSGLLRRIAFPPPHSPPITASAPPMPPGALLAPPSALPMPQMLK
jgi:hypothetical protein